MFYLFLLSFIQFYSFLFVCGGVAGTEVEVKVVVGGVIGGAGNGVKSSAGGHLRGRAAVVVKLGFDAVWRGSGVLTY